MNKYGKIALVFLQSAIVAVVIAYLFNLMGNLLVRHTWMPLGETIQLIPDSTQTFAVKTEFKADYHIRIRPWDTSTFTPTPVHWQVMLKDDTIGTGTWNGTGVPSAGDDTCLEVGKFKSWANDDYTLSIRPDPGTSSAKPATVDLRVSVAPQFQQNYELRAGLSRTLSKMVIWLASVLGLGALILFGVAIVKR